MTNKYYLQCWALLLLALNTQAILGQTLETANQQKLTWSEYPELPPGPNHRIQPGVAGAFVGIHENVLIVAGGANFPHGPAWKGGSKVYHRQIYLLSLDDDGSSSEWLVNDNFSLPERVAYGLSVNTPRGLVCLGGQNDSTYFSAGFLLAWNSATRDLNRHPLTPLPSPLANFCGAYLEGHIYIAGSIESTDENLFARLDLDDPTGHWEILDPWPGPPRTHAYGVVQNTGDGPAFYLMHGRWKGDQEISTRYDDGFLYNPRLEQWEEVSSNRAFKDAAGGYSAGTAIAIGANHIAFFGGADGNRLNQLEQLESEMKNASDTTLQVELTAMRDSIQRNHPGFSRDIWAFHTITESWSKIGRIPHQAQVTTTAISWRNEIIIASGEIAPCIRTPKIHSVKIQTNQDFGTLNYLILGAYLFLLVILGLYLAKNQNSTEDFFKAGQRIPAWAAGLSIFGTQLSAITFMAVPAKTFATNWLYFILNTTIILVAPFIIAFFLPFFRRFNLTTAYEYLEKRFNLGTRLIGSVMYISLQLGRIGIVLLLPSLALSVVSGINVQTCILAMGILSIFYTVLGGIEAVIWTDVLQVIILLGGAALTLTILLLNLDFNLVLTQVESYNKLKIVDSDFDFSSPTIWVILLGGLATNIIQYGSDQTIVQRYLTTRDEEAARKSIWTGAWLALPATLIFFSIGTLLFVFYQSRPEALAVTLDNTDAIFPWFIVNELPQGISGLMIAAIFAASMSSLDSSMNSVSTVAITDFIRRLAPIRDEKKYLLWARGITATIGIIGIALAIAMAKWGVNSLWDQFNLFIGLFTGGLGGIFILGIFSSRANGQGAIIGLIVSGIVQFYLKEYTQVHFLLYAFTGMISCMITGYLASLFWPSINKDQLIWTLKGLRIHH